MKLSEQERADLLAVLKSDVYDGFGVVEGSDGAPGRGGSSEE